MSELDKYYLLVDGKWGGKAFHAGSDAEAVNMMWDYLPPGSMEVDVELATAPGRTVYQNVLYCGLKPVEDWRCSECL